MARLILLPPSSGRVHYELVEDVVTIGRAPENAVVLDDASVSGRHAELRAHGQHYQLRDLGSTNGTRVNGSVTTETTLRPGDRIRFGAVEARYEAMDVKATQPLPVAEKIEATTTQTSAAPPDFANASPFRARKHQLDRSRTLLFVAAAIAVLVFIAALVAVFSMHAPGR